MGPHFFLFLIHLTISIPMPLVPMDVGQLWTHLGIFNTGVGRNRYFGEKLVPVVVAAALWGVLWRGKHVCFHSDNMAVVSILSTKTAKSPPLMHLLRCFSFYCALYCINVSCVHVPGAIYAAADALSCNKLPLFSSLVPQALPFPIPASLVELLVASRPDWGSQAWTELFVRSLTGGSLSLHCDPMQRGSFVHC